MQTIPHIPLITVTPRPLNERLWTLYRREAAGTATRAERAELDALCDALERGAVQ
jgi:hypothetical protein